MVRSFLAAFVVVLAAANTAMAEMTSQCKPNEVLCVNTAGTAGLCYIPQDRWECCDGLLHYMGPGALDECCYNPSLKKTYLANFTAGGCLEFKRTPEPKPVVVPTTTAATAAALVSSSSNFAGLSVTNWILIGAGVLVIVGAVAFFIFQKKQKKHATDATGTEICILESKDTKPKEIMLFN